MKKDGFTLQINDTLDVNIESQIYKGNLIIINGYQKNIM